MSATGGRPFDRVVVIMFENEFRGYVAQNPYMRSLASRGIDLAYSFGVMHPSNTNYLAATAGEICNVTMDPLYYTFLPAPVPPQPGPDPLTQTTIVDHLAAKGLAWHEYAESYQPVGWPPQLAPVDDPAGGISTRASVQRTILDYPPYLNMHNPFVRFQSVVQNEKQWKRIATSYDFLRDALDDTLPELSWFTPDIWSCGHWMWGTYDEPKQRGKVLVDQLANWLERFFGVLAFPGPQSRLPKGTLVVVTFDEADYNDSYETVRGWDGTYDGPNQIYTVLLGDMIEPRRSEDEGYNHYSLLKTIEMNFDLPSLGKNDREANWFQFLWKREFSWDAAEPTPIDDATMVAAASLGGSLYVVYGSGGSLQCRVLDDGRWSEPQPVPAPADVTAIAMAAASGSLTLVCQSGGALFALSMAAGGTWTQPQSLVTSAGAFSVASFNDYGDQTEKIMLAWSDGGPLHSQVQANGTWSDAVAVGHETDGAVVLATLGASVFVTFKTTGRDTMQVVSYNTAPFNVVTSSTNSNTTQYVWSPGSHAVAHFAAGPSREDGDVSELAPYLGVAPFVAATLDGAIHLAHGAPKSDAVTTETFSLSGILTPENPISYKADAAGVSNGYGTLAEAGWSPQNTIGAVTIGTRSGMAMARYDGRLVLLSQSESGSSLRMTVGAYRRSHAGG